MSRLASDPLDAHPYILQYMYMAVQVDILYLMSATTRNRHLFLLTGDWTNNHELVRICVCMVHACARMRVCEKGGRGEIVAHPNPTATPSHVA